MILGKYMNEYGALETLKKLRLKVSRLSNFNDPFENSPYVEREEISTTNIKKFLKDKNVIDSLYEKPIYRSQIGGKNKREFKKILKSMNKEELVGRISIEGLKKEVDDQKKVFEETCRVLCLSKLDEVEPYEEILMWSHYSDGHSGIRITFNTRKIDIKATGPTRVFYQKERIRLNARKLVSLDPRIFAEYSKAMIVKSDAWSYENEYRWLINMDECFIDKNIDVDFIKIAAASIVKVDIGVNASDSLRKEIALLLREKEYAHIECNNARLDKEEFKINYDRAET